MKEYSCRHERAICSAMCQREDSSARTSEPFIRTPIGSVACFPSRAHPTHSEHSRGPCLSVQNARFRNNNQLKNLSFISIWAYFPYCNIQNLLLLLLGRNQNPLCQRRVEACLKMCEIFIYHMISKTGG